MRFKSKFLSVFFLGLSLLLKAPSAFAEEVSRARHLPAGMLGFLRELVQKSLPGKWKGWSEDIALAIVREAQRFRFDPFLLAAVIQHESRFSPLALGSHGEIGLMQLKPSTAAWVAKRMQLPWKGKSTLRDPLMNIRLGSAYLALLREKFSARSELYLAAYNMGAGQVMQDLRQRGTPHRAGVRYHISVMRNYQLYQRILREGVA